jgi:hypothetical protein
MTVERALRGWAGGFALAGAGLADGLRLYRLGFVAFVGANLLPWAFPYGCPRMT